MFYAYSFHKEILLRTPFLSFEQYSSDYLTSVSTNNFFQIALYLANPTLFEVLKKKNFAFQLFSEKEKVSVFKYYNRMCFRPTPFGAFSAISAVEWNDSQFVTLADQSQAKLNIFLDNDIVIKLAKKLKDDSAFQDLYTLNPTSYKLNRDYRFIRTDFDFINSKISFSLEVYESNRLSKELIQFLDKGSKTGFDILNWLQKEKNILHEDACEYLHFLIRSQFLRSRSDLNIVGPEYLMSLVKNKRLQSPFSLEIANIYTAIQKLNAPDLGKITDLNAQIDSLAKTLYVNKPKSNFYVITEKMAAGGMQTEKQGELLSALNCLLLFSQPVRTENFNNFAKSFVGKFDRERIPILKALDPDFGVGYGDLTAIFEENQLLAKVDFPSAEEKNQTLEWSDLHAFILKKWTLDKKFDGIIKINSEEIESFKMSIGTTAPTVAVLFRNIGSKILIENVSGTSANTLLGRFTKAGERFRNISIQLARAEEDSNSEVIFAEIGQLSDFHIDNINRRESIYTYEIPINANSVLPEEKQIHLSDLYISVVENEVILESKILNRRIIPRLSSAYNYYNNELSIFRFLCDLQLQGLRTNLNFDLESFFPGMTYYPRVEFADTIIHLAKWILKDEISLFTETDFNKILYNLNMLRHQFSVPDLVSLIKSDQQIVFNLSIPDDVKYFVSSIKGLKKITLQEYLPPTGERQVYDSSGKKYIGQYAAFLSSNQTVYKNFSGEWHDNKISSKKVYHLGSEWLYLKIYCTPALSNYLLVHKICPAINSLRKKKDVQWFFVRYNDPEYHIRLRIHIDEMEIGRVITQLKTNFADVLDHNLIREYQANAYRKEVERYGQNNILVIEEIFHLSSEVALAFLSRSEDDHEYQSHWTAMLFVKEIVTVCIPKADNQIEFLQQMALTFYREFNADKSLKTSLDLKYRELKHGFEESDQNDIPFKKNRSLNHYSNLISAIEVFFSKRKRMTFNRKNQLLVDIIHMHLNRLFIIEPRQQELIVYHYCLKNKISEQKRMNKKY